MRSRNEGARGLRERMAFLPEDGERVDAPVLRVLLRRSFSALPEPVLSAAGGGPVLLDFSLGYEGLACAEAGFRVEMTFRGSRVALDVPWEAVASWQEAPRERRGEAVDNVVFVDFSRASAVRR